MNKKVDVDPEMANMFSQIFNGKAPENFNQYTDDQKKELYKFSKMNNPKIVVFLDKIFNTFQSLVSKIIPAVLFAVISFRTFETWYTGEIFKTFFNAVKYLFINGLTCLLLSGFSFILVEIVHMVVMVPIITVYTYKLKSGMKKYKTINENIKKELKRRDTKDKEEKEVTSPKKVEFESATMSEISQEDRDKVSAIKEELESDEKYKEWLKKNKDNPKFNEKTND